MKSKEKFYYFGRGEITLKNGKVMSEYSFVDPISRQTISFYGDRADFVFGKLQISDNKPLFVNLTIEWRRYDGKWKPIPISVD